VKPDPSWILNIFGRRKRSLFFFGRGEQDQADPSLTLGSGPYFRLVNRLPKVCLEANLPQLWSNDDDTLNSLTLDQVIDDLNKTSIR